MGPPVAVIVGGTVVTVGLVVAFHELAWPHIKPHAQEFVDQCSARFKAFRGRRRHRATPHRTSTRPRKDGNESSSGDTFDEVHTRSSLATQDPLISPLDDGATAAWSSEKDTTPRNTLRLRANIPRKEPSERMFGSEVEMVQLDQANPLITYTPMSPTHSRPTSTAPSDIDPFEEPSVPVATVIPLPVSPESSIIVERKAAETSSLMTRSSTATSQSFISAPTREQPSSTPPTAASPQVQPSSAFSTVRGRSSPYQPSASQSPPAGVLGPAMLQSSTREVRSPVARALSPSGVSETASLVSATPSRNWTEAGTADIFSGDERDFHEAEAESDDDVRSVSESGSWENVSAAGRDGMTASGRSARERR